VPLPGLLGNDTDPDGDPLSAIFIAGPAHGTLTLHATGDFTYRPDPNYNGLDAFTYRASDGSATSGPANVAINVMPVNDPPSFTKGPNQNVLAISGPQSIANWATAISAGPPDESSQTLTFQVTNNNNALFAVQPAIDASGRLTYTPATGTSGQAMVTVLLVDNGGTAGGGVNTSLQQTFTISVNQIRPWHNFAFPENVDNFGEVAPNDAILIINYLNARLPHIVPTNAPPGPPFYDVSGNNIVSPLDAVLVINWLNARRIV
jgi:Bacterial Ig domain/Dockerin type I domain